MKTKLMFVVAALLLSVNVYAGDEEAGVRAAVEHYFQGHATGEGQHFAKVFHPASSLFAVRDGKFLEIPSADYIGRASGKPAADEPKRSRKIESVDITGNAAMAKVTLDYPAVKFTDYLSLLKVDGEWKIVNKIFYAEQRGAKK